MTSLTMVGELQPNQTTELRFDLATPQLWGAYNMLQLHVGRVALRSTAPDALDRLGAAQLWIHFAARGYHDEQLLQWRQPVNLRIRLRNDMTQPFLEVNETIPTARGNTSTDKIRYWHLTVEFTDLELLPGETATVALTPLN